LPRHLVWFGGLWLAATVLQPTGPCVLCCTNPVMAIVLSLLNALIVYLRRDEFASNKRIIAKVR
jgi:hypothetical protein